MKVTATAVAEAQDEEVLVAEAVERMPRLYAELLVVVPRVPIK